ncbi:MAG: DUF58 domain-containing protein [Caldilineae bacterium]|nr:MAG: DUF58 domain-containing protein [Caldilineae bacterium]
MRRTTWIALLIWLLSLVAALNTGRDLMYNVFYMLTILLVGSWLWAWSNVNWLALTRYTRARRSQVGKFAEEQFQVVNRSRLPKLWLEVRDHSTLPGHHPSRVVSSIGGRKKRTWVVRTLCYRRGRYRLGPLTLRSGDPLGIFELKRFLPQTGTILVYPATVDVSAFKLPEGQIPGGEATRHRTHYLTTNVATVRDYVPGDSFNRIHWRSTARTGRLIVKEFELDPTSDIWLMLDLDPAYHHAQPWSPPDEYGRPALLWNERPSDIVTIPATIEYAITAAASLARRYLGERRAVGLITYTHHREIIQADRGERQLNKILETLAVLEPTGVLPFDRLLTAEGNYLDRASSVIAITPSTDLTWVAALRELRRRGVNSTAILIAANTFGPAPRYEDVLDALWASNIPTYLLRRGDDVSQALSHFTRPD